MQVNHVYCGDSLEVLKRFPDNSVDAVVTDPPYGLSREPDIEEVLTKWLAGEDYEHRGGGFMGKSWDSFVPGPALWREVRRVVKPGGHILCFAGTRTVDLMGIALRLGGWEIRDTLQWLYGSGFPKSHDISKAIDRMKGVEREVVGCSGSTTRNFPSGECGVHGSLHKDYQEKGRNQVRLPITEPATSEAQQWSGWGTHLKPANEPILLARKPLSERTIAANVLEWGTGGINVDAARIGDFRNDTPSGIDRYNQNYVNDGAQRRRIEGTTSSKTGRFPANVIFDEVAAAVLDEQSGDLKGGTAIRRNSGGNTFGGNTPKPQMEDLGYGDSGGASRFFKVIKGDRFRYVAKASRRERTHNGKVDNIHPTVKPVALMEYLLTLITRPGGIVLDPFCGSGTTLVAAKGLGFDYIGIDMSEEYVELTKQRLDATPNKAEQAAMF